MKMTIGKLRSLIKEVNVSPLPRWAKNALARFQPGTSWQGVSTLADFGVPLKSGPSARAKTLTVLPAGAVITVQSTGPVTEPAKMDLHRDSVWVPVEHDGITGYVEVQHLRRDLWRPVGPGGPKAVRPRRLAPTWVT